ncbi:MAG TPA: phage major capsid protein [Marmoricola sp.]|nr:phage major capsid protein [Marmoricola sp.]
MDYSFILGAQRDAAIAERDGLLNVEDPKDFTAESEARVAELNKEIREISEKLDQARKDEAAEVESRGAEPVETAEARKQTPHVQVSEPNPVYRKGGDKSYFRDLFFMGTGGTEAAQARDNMVRSQETRALTTSATAGGTFAPPAWLINEYIEFARSARVTADLVQHEVLEGGQSSINLPAVTGGTTVGVVQTQNTAVSNTDITTSSVSSGITTIAGQQVVSLQLLRQSGIPFDRVVLGDLALAYASQLDVQVISGSGANGQLKGLIAAGTTVTYTTTAPSVVSTTAANSFYNKIIAGEAAVWENRFLAADALVITPTRLGWLQQALDANNRPLFLPGGAAFNPIGGFTDQVAQGYVGTLTTGIPVYVDPNIPRNRGVATNQDVAIILRRSDHWLYETPVEQTTWEATYANQNSVLFRALGFSAFVTRYANSAQIIDGTGMVQPTL